MRTKIQKEKLTLLQMRGKLSSEGWAAKNYGKVYVLVPGTWLCRFLERTTKQLKELSVTINQGDYGLSNLCSTYTDSCNFPHTILILVIKGNVS